MGLIVTKPGGLMWSGVLYETGTVLPPDVAREVVRHPNYPSLVAAGYIAADGSYEALSRGLSTLKDDLAMARAQMGPESIDLDLDDEEEEEDVKSRRSRR